MRVCIAFCQGISVKATEICHMQLVNALMKLQWYGRWNAAYGVVHYFLFLHIGKTFNHNYSNSSIRHEDIQWHVKVLGNSVPYLRLRNQQTKYNCFCPSSMSQGSSMNKSAKGCQSPKHERSDTCDCMFIYLLWRVLGKTKTQIWTAITWKLHRSLSKVFLFYFIILFSIKLKYFSHIGVHSWEIEIFI